MAKTDIGTIENSDHLDVLRQVYVAAQQGGTALEDFVKRSQDYFAGYSSRTENERWHE